MRAELRLTPLSGPQRVYPEGESGFSLDPRDRWHGAVGALPGAGFPPPRELAFSFAGGARLASVFLGSTAEVYLDDELAVRGRVEDLAFTGDGTLTGVIRPVSKGGALIPPPASTVSELTFPRESFNRADPYSGVGTVYSDSNALGRVPPWIIGNPGQGVTSTFAGAGYFSSSFPCAPALLAEANDTISVTPQSATDNVLVIAGHKMVSVACGVINMSAIGTADAGGEPTFEASIEYGTDEAGNLFAYLRPSDYTAFSSILDRGYAGGDYFSIMIPASLGLGEPGGLPSPYSPGALRKAGEVVRWAADLSGIAFDTEKIGWLASFDDYKIDAYLDEPVDIWEWAQSEVLPLLPAMAVQGGRGAFLTRLDFWGPAQELTGQWEVIGQVQVGSLDIVQNEFVLNFAPNPHGGRRPYAGTASIGPSNDPLCATSAVSYGSRPSLSETSVVWDPTTAGLIVGWKPALYAHPLLSVRLALHGKTRATAPEVGVKLAFDLTGFGRVEGFVTAWQDFGRGWVEVEVVAPLR